jgi:hypothetical protein
VEKWRGDRERRAQEVFDPLTHLFGEDRRSHTEETMKTFSRFG